MATPRITRARQLAAQLTGPGITATHDVREVGGNSSGVVLIGPPRLSFETTDGAVATWRLLVIAGTSDQHTAWEQLDGLLDLLAEQLPCETAEPVSWAPSPGEPTRPAYAVTYTETVE